MSKSFIASVFMVAGCAMGAGCLALPFLAAGPDFLLSSLFIILTAGFSYLLAIVSLEIFLLYKNEANVATIVKANFGHAGVVFATVINGALMYALLSVYMTGGADVLDKSIFPLIDLHVTDQVALLIFLMIFIPIFFKGIGGVVKSNQIIFSIKLISFLVVVIIGLAFLTPNLGNFTLADIRYLPKALPIFLGALWFHFAIPVIARINNYDRERSKKVFLFGLLLPAILYILWIGVMLSLVPREGIGNTFFSLIQNHQSVGMMIQYATHNNPHLPIIMTIALDIFSNVALLTSFLVVGASTYDYLRDVFKIKQDRIGVMKTLLLTMLPPAFFAVFFPNGFVFILQQAIVLLLITNAIVLICSLKEYTKLLHKPNRWLICGVLFWVLVLIILQLLDDFGFLASFAQ